MSPLLYLNKFCVASELNVMKGQRTHGAKDQLTDKVGIRDRNNLHEHYFSLVSGFFLRALLMFSTKGSLTSHLAFIKGWSHM